MLFWPTFSGRVNEFDLTFGAQVDVSARFVSVFGNAPGKLGRGWSTRGSPPTSTTTSGRRRAHPVIGQDRGVHRGTRDRTEGRVRVDAR
jgi:hypothetical protein